MLSKKNRLTRSQFDEYFKRGKRFHSPHLQLIYTPAEQFSGAAVVGKKVFKKAVDRNTMRRRLYGVLYREGHQRGRTGIFILIAKPPAKQLARAALLTEARMLVTKVR